MPKNYDFPKPKSPARNSGVVPNFKAPEAGRVVFSFKYLLHREDKFNYKKKDQSYFCQVVEKLKNICQMTREDMRRATIKNYGTLRFHPIEWDNRYSETSFNIPGDITDDAYQFAISKGLGRIHGFFTSQSVFNVVWLDPDHELIPWTE